MRTMMVLGLLACAACQACSATASQDSSSSNNSGGNSGATGDAGAPVRDASASASSDDAGEEADEYAAKPCNPAAKAGEFYALSAAPLGEPNGATPMCNFRGRVAMVVNVASECGYTPQYAPLQQLYAKYKSRGFVVLGFPSNQFGSQEPGTAAEISNFCTTKYQITFPMFSKTDVNGASQHPIYKWLKSQPNATGDIGWNFTKFLVGRTGTVLKRFGSSVEPDDAEVVSAIEAALSASP